MKTKIVGKRKRPIEAQELHAAGAKFDREAEALAPRRTRGFVVKFRTWEDLERWETARAKRSAASVPEGRPSRRAE
jgi:hypothetical protein